LVAKEIYGNLVLRRPCFVDRFCPVIVCQTFWLVATVCVYTETAKVTAIIIDINWWTLISSRLGCSSGSNLETKLLIQWVENATTQYYGSYKSCITKIGQSWNHSPNGYWIRRHRPPTVKKLLHHQVGSQPRNSLYKSDKECLLFMNNIKFDFSCIGFHPTTTLHLITWQTNLLKCCGGLPLSLTCVCVLPTSSQIRVRIRNTGKFTRSPCNPRLNFQGKFVNKPIYQHPTCSLWIWALVLLI
jgi:hypothetical protein